MIPKEIKRRRVYVCAESLFSRVTIRLLKPSKFQPFMQPFSRTINASFDGLFGNTQKLRGFTLASAINTHQRQRFTQFDRQKFDGCTHLFELLTVSRHLLLIRPLVMNNRVFDAPPISKKTRCFPPSKTVAAFVEDDRGQVWSYRAIGGEPLAGHPH